MNFCTDCLHCNKLDKPPADSADWLCTRPPDLNPVSSLPFSDHASTECYRERMGLTQFGCGHEGRFFQKMPYLTSTTSGKITAIHVDDNTIEIGLQ